MDSSIKTLVPETPSTDGSEDSWTFLDDVENNVEVETMQSLLDVKPMPSDVESLDDVEEPSDVNADHVEHVEVGTVATKAISAENKSAAKAFGDTTDGEISDGSVSLISGNEFSRDNDEPRSASSLPPSPFWMRAHIPELPLALQPKPLRDVDLDVQPSTVVSRSLPVVKAQREVAVKQSSSAEPEPANLQNVANIFLYGMAGFCVVVMSILLAHYFSSLTKINQLRSIIHGLESENIKLQYRYTECRKVELAYNAQKHATDAAAAVDDADMQIVDQKDAFVTADDFDAPMQIDKYVAEEPELYEPMGRKVWTSDGFVLQATHLPPKKQFKHEDLCDKKIRDDLFSEYTSEYCEKVRQSKHNAEGKRAPVHTHQPRGDTNKADAEPIFIEDFIDPNKFNPNAYYDDQYEEFKQIDQLIEELDGFSDDDDEFKFDLKSMSPNDVNFSGIVPKGYDSFEDSLLKLDEQMEKISFHTNSCHTKYKKLKEDEERKSIRKFDKSKIEKSKKKYKEREDEKREKRREARNDRKDEKREKRERKYNEKKDKKRN